MKLKIYRPLSSNRLSQGFSDNFACVKTSNGRPIRPFKVLRGKYTGTCPANSTKFYPAIGLKAHNGFDWAAYYKEPGYFAAEFDAWLKYERDPDGGIGVDAVSKERILKCTERGCDDVHYIKQRLWHNHSNVGLDRRDVVFGERIALANSTGASSGNHFHEGYKWCNKEGRGLHKNNSYYGAFDIWNHPEVEFTNKFVLDEINDRAKEAKGEEVLVTEELTTGQLLSKATFQLQNLIIDLTNYVINLVKGR